MSSTATPDTGSTVARPPTNLIVADTATLAELADLLADPAVRAWALAPNQGDNQAIQVGSGTAGQLVRRARLGTDAAVWAIVAPPRPELVALDIDECADLVLPEIRQAAAETATDIVAAVASGRPDCLHLWCVPATQHGRDELLRQIAGIRRHHDLPAGAIDHRDGKAIRLPGSASLKPTGRSAQLIELDTGAPIEVRTVLYAVRSALPQQASAAAAKTPQRRRPAPTTAPLPLEGEGVTRLVTEAPRAWRPRRPFTPDDWSVLNDDTSRDRSAAATAAAWVLWRHGIRSSAAALWWYQRVSAFDKFRQRDEEARVAGRSSDWLACSQHWSAIVRRARGYRPDSSAADRQLLDAAREEIQWWDNAELQATAAVVIDRFDDGYGLTDRPLARRDLQLELHLSDGVATSRLDALVRRGLLVRTAQWSASAPREAARYSLKVPAATYRGESAHDVTSPAVPLRHALWGVLPQAARRALVTLLSHPPTPARTMATLLGLPLGDATHGVRHLLRLLESAGLAQRTGTGRGTTWSAASSPDLDAAATLTGAATRARELAARICGERACWHAESHAEATRSHHGLEALRRRITHIDVRGRRPRPPRPTRPRRSTLHSRRPPPGDDHAGQEAQPRALPTLPAHAATPHQSRSRSPAP